jgi:hypothetical protein
VSNFLNRRPFVLKTIAIAFTALMLALPTAGQAADAEPDAKKFTRLTQALETDPLQATGREMRAWLFNWMEKSPDVTITVCDVLGPIPSDKPPFGLELWAQALAGNAAFQIAHPDKKRDAVATQVAGVESMLKSYAVILATDPKARIPYVDELLKFKAAGKLKVFMEPLVAKKCSDTASN